MSRVDEIMGLNDPSDVEQDAYGSSDEEQGRTSRTGRASQAAAAQSDAQDSDSESENANTESNDKGGEPAERAQHVEGNDSLDPEPFVKPLSEEDNKKRLTDIKKSGVIYLSSIPPYMKPVKVRQILSRFGEVNRIYLVPEDSIAHSKRVRSGGNKRQKFVEGWAEFRNKKDAKLAVESLNGNPIGGKKRSYYYDDILNMKYLPKFKWHDLTEQFALEAQERQEKMKAEIIQAKRENRIFMDNVERKATIDRKKRRAAEGKTGEEIEEERTHAFSQRPVKQAKKSQGAGSKGTASGSSSDLSKVLSKVF